MDPVEPDVLEEQLAYYRARAAEYDRWFLREGRYDRGAESTEAWRAELDVVRALLAAEGLAGCDVLELAAGTGLWTSELVALGARVTAVDGAPEMLSALTARIGEGHVTTVEADLFAWRPDRAYDAVVSCFFVSHVPDEHLDGFLGLVAAGLRPGGRAFLLDGLREATSTAADHELPAGSDQTMQRALDDGRRFTIVKRFRAADELRAACARQGLDVEVRTTERYFQVVHGTRR